MIVPAPVLFIVLFRGGNFMDAMHIAYFEETEELLQRAEECLIRLESGYSEDEINELFRIAHSIKGSSQMIGYDHIGNFTHRLEDLLDSVRKGRIPLDGEVLRLCFEGLDHVKKMVEFKKTNFEEEIGQDVLSASDRLGREIEFILGKRPETKSARPEPPAGGIVSALKETKNPANRRVYISVFFSDDAPMVQASLFMIFNNIKEIGSLEYSNISDDDIFSATLDRPVSSCEMILNTDLEVSELYPYFEVMYVENIAIVDVSDRALRERAFPHDGKSLEFFELFFEEYKKLHPLLFRQQAIHGAKLEDMIRRQSAKIMAEAKRLPFHAVLPYIERFYEQCLLLLAGRTKLRREMITFLRREYMNLLEKVYGHVRGKVMYKIVKARDRHFRQRLNEAVEWMNKSLVRMVLVDVSDLPMLDEGGLADLIRIKRQLGEMDISIGIVAGRPMNKRVVNIFESIRPLEDFEVYGTELDAVLGIS